MSLQDDVVEVSISEVLAFRAPYLTERLQKYGIVDSPEEGEKALEEVVKYIILCRMDEDTDWQMYSLLVDEVWHQFILYTEAYTNFCERFFGGYVGHSPSNAPPPEEGSSGAPAKQISTFAGFRQRYRDVFGEDLPSLWFDQQNLRPWRRVFNRSLGEWRCRARGDMIDVSKGQDGVLVSFDALAAEPLDFISRTLAFYVREIPGDLTDEEAEALVAALMGCGLLRLGP